MSIFAATPVPPFGFLLFRPLTNLGVSVINDQTLLVLSIKV